MLKTLTIQVVFDNKLKHSNQVSQNHVITIVFLNI